MYVAKTAGRFHNYRLHYKGWAGRRGGVGVGGGWAARGGLYFPIGLLGVALENFAAHLARPLLAG